jgi:hypothetical protein
MPERKLAVAVKKKPSLKKKRKRLNKKLIFLIYKLIKV